MSSIYIALVDTPGIFAEIIRRVLKQKYVHVALALDENLEEVYSIGRRHPAIPFFAGFAREDKAKILKKFPSAEYMVYRVECTPAQRAYIKETLREAMKQRYRYHYAIIGLVFLLLNRAYHQKRHYTCSSYLAELLQDAGVYQWEKPFSLVTPRDFYQNADKQVVFEGPLRVLVAERGACANIKSVIVNT